MKHSNVALFTALFTVFFLFMLGWTRAVMARANADYKATKAVLPKLRKAFWVAVWRVIKFGTGAALIFALIVVWNVRDVRDGDQNTPLIPEKAKASPTAKSDRSPR